VQKAQTFGGARAMACSPVPKVGGAAAPSAPPVPTPMHDCTHGLSTRDASVQTGECKKNVPEKKLKNVKKRKNVAKIFKNVKNVE